MPKYDLSDMDVAPVEQILKGPRSEPVPARFESTLIHSVTTSASPVLNPSGTSNLVMSLDWLA